MTDLKEQNIHKWEGIDQARLWSTTFFTTSSSYTFLITYLKRNHPIDRMAVQEKGTQTAIRYAEAISDLEDDGEF